MLIKHLEKFKEMKPEKIVLCDVLLALATISWGQILKKGVTFIPTLFLTSRPAARNYQFRFYLMFVTFHGPRSPQLENGTFERVSASVRDRRACPETKESGFTLLRQCFRNNVCSTCINFLLPSTRRVFRHYNRSFLLCNKVLSSLEWNFPWWNGDGRETFT